MYYYYFYNRLNLFYSYGVPSVGFYDTTVLIRVQNKNPDNFEILQNIIFFFSILTNIVLFYFLFNTIRVDGDVWTFGPIPCVPSTRQWNIYRKQEHADGVFWLSPIYTLQHVTVRTFALFPGASTVIFRSSLFSQKVFTIEKKNTLGKRVNTFFVNKKYFYRIQVIFVYTVVCILIIDYVLYNVTFPNRTK